MEINSKTKNLIPIIGTTIFALQFLFGPWILFIITIIKFADINEDIATIFNTINFTLNTEALIFSIFITVTSFIYKNRVKYDILRKKHSVLTILIFGTFACSVGSGFGSITFPMLMSKSHFNSNIIIIYWSTIGALALINIGIIAHLGYIKSGAKYKTPDKIKNVEYKNSYTLFVLLIVLFNIAILICGLFACNANPNIRLIGITSYSHLSIQYILYMIILIIIQIKDASKPPKETSASFFVILLGSCAPRLFFLLCLVPPNYFGHINYLFFTLDIISLVLLICKIYFLFNSKVYKLLTGNAH